MLWFLNALVTFPVAHADGDDGISIMESFAPRGESAPYHLHRTEDEVFHLIEGEIVLLVDGATRRVRAGGTHLAPKGVPHSYRVVSDRARWLITTTNGDFERFVRDVSRPATRRGLPRPAGPPTAEQQTALAELAARHGIDLIGPPLSEEMAQAARL